MKTRLTLVVCLLTLAVLPLGAQTLIMSNGWSQSVTAQAQNVTGGGPVQSQPLNQGNQWNTGMPANPDTDLKIAFLQGSNYLANTPFLVSDVVKATLVYNSTYNIVSVFLTPAPTGAKHEHDVTEANAFLAMKTPTKEFCLTVLRLKNDRLLLGNGLIVAAAGDLKLLPKEGASGCVCGRGLAPAPKTYVERFEVKARCEAPKK